MINYAYLTQAIETYARQGFVYIDVPWVVSEKAVEITAPPAATKYPLGSDYLVASGEQSFLELILAGNLKEGRWCCLTPCYRDDKIDDLHKRCFMKVELIATTAVNNGHLECITRDCLLFFNKILPGCMVGKTSPIDPLLVEGTARDIFSPQGIELGSYGIRQHPDIGSWIYATGCAEPRLSTALKISKDVTDAKTS